MKHLYLGTIAAGALALVLGSASGASAGGDFGAAPAVYTDRGEGGGFALVEAGGRYDRHRDRNHGRRGDYRRHHRDHGHHHRPRAYKYTRGYAHYGYPYYDRRARYSRPYGFGGFGLGYRSGRDCW